MILLWDPMSHPARYWLTGGTSQGAEEIDLEEKQYTLVLPGKAVTKWSGHCSLSSRRDEMHFPKSTSLELKQCPHLSCPAAVASREHKRCLSKCATQAHVQAQPNFKWQVCPTSHSTYAFSQTSWSSSTEVLRLFQAAGSHVRMSSLEREDMTNRKSCESDSLEERCIQFPFPCCEIREDLQKLVPEWRSRMRRWQKAIQVSPWLFWNRI